jgi:hypothetical protein
MRGTLHFVPAQDIRWMLKLLTPRVVARSASRYRQLELDERTFARSNDVLVRALQGGRTLTRNEMYGVLEAAHISTIGQRGIHILAHLAQNGLICFAARQAKQQTFALLEEWVPVTRNLERVEGLAELTRRYFTSRGPATLQDYVWWSGLKTTDARAGIEMVRKDLEEDVIEGQAYWFPSRAASKRQLKNGVAAHLLPAYDEYTVAYKDRRAVLSPTHANESKGILSPTILMNGRVVGTWKRSFQKDTVVITPSPFARLNNTEAQALTTASNRYGKFLGASALLL